MVYFPVTSLFFFLRPICIDAYTRFQSKLPYQCFSFPSMFISKILKIFLKTNFIASIVEKRFIAKINSQHRDKEKEEKIKNIEKFVIHILTMISDNKRNKHRYVYRSIFMSEIEEVSVLFWREKKKRKCENIKQAGLVRSIRYFIKRMEQPVVFMQ